MISLILYGRNDSYGYNLHKRAAISLNCMAELLTAQGDEIIFVDYNTPDDFPTFPEAIQDTLTEKAKSLLRILRVRPKQHERFRDKTHLVALEPIARNVAIRRSNPENRWILSTNTDMVFVPRRGRSLSEIAAELKDAYYHLPRFEVPETLWESVDRTNPRAIIAAFQTWGTQYHLNEIVLAWHPDVRYDGPGDFQLILRSDLWCVSGFHESMLLGWHVDSNMARRLALLPRQIGDVLDDLYGYHCDHTRQVTPAHRARAAANDQKMFFEDVSRADIPEQRDNWGLAGESVEEVSLAANRTYLAALSAAITCPLDKPTEIGYTGESFNRQDYSAEHVVPFLIDSVSSYSRDAAVAWMGAKKSMLRSFAAAWSAMGFIRPIFVFDNARWLGSELPEGCRWAAWDEACESADVFVFDWGRPETDSSAPWIFQKDPIIRDVSRAFRKTVRNERPRLAGNARKLRRFIGINAINNAVEGMFKQHIAAALTPLSTHIRQGFLSELTPEILPLLYAGKAGQKFNDRIASIEGVSGYVFYGPYLDLDSSGYSLTLSFSDVRFLSDGPRLLGLEVTSNGRLIAYREISECDLKSEIVTFEFSVAREVVESDDWPAVEFRLMTPGSLAFNIRSAVLEETTSPAHDKTKLESFDCAPLLTVGPAGVPVTSRNSRREVQAREGIEDLLVHGPNFWLPTGRYNATFSFRIENADDGDEIAIYATTNLGRRVLASNALKPAMPGTHDCSVEFTLGADLPSQETGLLEFPVWSSGRSRFALTSVRLDQRESEPLESRLAEAATDNGEILYLTHTGRAGKSLPGRVLALPGAGGIVFFGPYLELARGNYQLEIRFSESEHGIEHMEDCGLAIAAVSQGHIVAYHDITARDLAEKRATLDFDIADPKYGRRLEVVLRTTGQTKVSICSAVLREREAGKAVLQAGAPELLKFLEVGEAGEWRRFPDSSGKSAIRHVPASQGYVGYGPYLALEAGKYEVNVQLYINAGNRQAPITLDVAQSLGKDVLAKSVVTPGKLPWLARRSRWECVAETLRFDVPESVPPEERFEFRVFALGGGEFFVTSLRVEKLTPAAQVREAVVARSP